MSQKNHKDILKKNETVLRELWPQLKVTVKKSYDCYYCLA